MKKHLHLLFLIVALLAVTATARGQSTSQGDDFWVLFLHNGGDQQPEKMQITAIGDDDCTMTLTSPMRAWSHTTSFAAGDSATVTLPDEFIPSRVVGATFDQNAIHVTTTTPVTLLATQIQLASTAAALVLPTAALRSQYVVLDYPADPGRSSVTGATVGFVAIADSTTLAMALPCSIPGHAAGSTLSITLQAGQAYRLTTNTANQSFSGMTVTGNKPFAMFQGNEICGLPYDGNGNSGDYIYEQAIPLEHWGTDYALVSSARTVGDRVRVTAAEPCTVTLSDGSSMTLAAGECRELTLSPTTALRLWSTKPVGVAQYMCNSTYNGEAGDATMCMIPSLGNGVSYASFTTFTTQRINQWYLNIVVRTALIGSLTLDGTTLSASMFTALDTTYSYAKLVLSSGIHRLNCTQGTFVAWTHGVGNVEGYSYPVGLSYTSPDTIVQSCPTNTNKGNDFWVTFFHNYHSTESNNPGHHTLIGLCDEECNLTVTGGENGSVWEPLNTSNNYCARINVGDNNNLPVAIPYNGGYHITSDKDIWLYAQNYIQCTQDIATILPTSALDTTYVVQDYPAWEYGAQVAFVATEDNTVLTMTVPCNIHGTSIMAGTTLTPTLMQGQAYYLVSDGNMSSFSGMRVTSNGKPFAMFQGGRRVKVPNSGSGSDLLFEQGLKTGLWGTEFVVTGAWAQDGSSYVRILSSEDNCTVSVNGTITTTLSEGAIHNLIMPTSQAYHIVTSKPALVILYLTSHVDGNNKGDPSSVTIPPVDRGVCDSRYYTSFEWAANEHYLALVCDTAWDSGMLLDDQPLPTSDTTTIGRYRIHRIHHPSSLSPITVHKIHNDLGPYIGYAYGIGYYESYAFPLGFRLDVEDVTDTIEYSDTICQNGNYEGYGFSVGSTETIFSGTVERWREATVGNSTHHYHLTLTVLPLSHGDTVAYITLGDTLFFQGDTLTQAGTYLYTLTAANGCDSLLTLYLNWDGVDLTASATGICSGDSVVLTANGTPYAYWTATPNDPTLDGQQGQTTVTVFPQQTTTYGFSSYEDGPTEATVTIGVDPSPTLCVDLSRPFIDFDFPVVIFTDCNESSASSKWTFSDGIILNAAKARRQFRHPLPDSVSVTLTSCTPHNCCVDTTFTIASKTRNVWFPNVFTPDQDENNRFGCVTNIEVSGFELYIYTRMGQLVYHTDDPNALWDGTYNGQPLPQATYTYYWHLHDAVDYNHSGIGTVTLIR